MSGDVIVPLGVPHNDRYRIVVDSGIDDDDWTEYTEVRRYTNAFIVQDGKILLGYKKRGYGQGLWNGFGGKVEPGENSLQAAERELQEEAGIRAQLRLAGTLFFIDPKVEWAFHIDIFVANTFTGQITESEEMKPQWFCAQLAEDTADPEVARLPQIPYDHMWADDIYWMPQLLRGTPFAGRMDFKRNGTLRRWWVAKITN